MTQCVHNVHTNTLPFFPSVCLTLVKPVNNCNDSTLIVFTFSMNRSRNFRPGSYRKIRRRAVQKNGWVDDGEWICKTHEIFISILCFLSPDLCSECNVTQKRIAQRRIRFLQDIFTTLVDSQWRWTLFVFALSFVLSWLGFGVVWWLIAVTHGDLEDMHLPPKQGKTPMTSIASTDKVLITRFFFSFLHFGVGQFNQRTTIGCHAYSTYTVLRRVSYFQLKHSTPSATVYERPQKNVPKPYSLCVFNRFMA